MVDSLYLWSPSILDLNSYLDVLFRGERDLLGDLLLDLPPPTILVSSVKRSFFPCSSVLSNLSKAASIPRRSENSTNLLTKSFQLFAVTLIAIRSINIEIVCHNNIIAIYPSPLRNL